VGNLGRSSGEAGVLIYPFLPTLLTTTISKITYPSYPQLTTLSSISGLGGQDDGHVAAQVTRGRLLGRDSHAAPFVVLVVYVVLRITCQSDGPQCFLYSRLR